MKNIGRISLIIIAALAVGVLLTLLGYNIGQAQAVRMGMWNEGTNGYMMDSQAYPYVDSGTNMMGGSMMGSGMMDGNMMGMGWAMGAGMAGNHAMMGRGSSELQGLAPLTIPQTREALESYLAGLDAELEIGEIMIFDNHAYAELIEKDGGHGAMEVLIDPVTLAVSPEPGPGMMWNLKYGPMSAFNGTAMMGMGGNSQAPGMMQDVLEEISPDMTVAPEQAIESAQSYLDLYLPGATADDHSTPFYGYYTLHILRNGRTVGMLSVNGTSRQVFVHTWHGTLITAEAE